MTELVRFEIKLPVKIVKKTGYYIGSCPLLDVFTQGKTKKEAQNNLRDALELFLTSCFERGVLEEVLREAGFSPATEEMVRGTKPSSRSQDLMSVPVPMLYNAAKSSNLCPA